MSKNNTPFNWKKIPYYLTLGLLTTGASLILGFLGFSGMYTLTPLLPLAFVTFGLSGAYEAEIYLQNIKGALIKLFKNDYLQHRLAKEYLLQHFPEQTDEEQCPQFFKDYKAQLLLLNHFDDKELNKQSKKRKQQITKTLQDMEQWFTQQLFANKEQPEDAPSLYALELRQWLAQNQQEEWHKRLAQRKQRINMAKGFSALSALFMGLGSTYLIVEAFSVIPFFAAIPFAFWPAMIVPMAIIAGTAYGLLTYNAVTDLINNNTVVKWFNKIKDDLKQGITPRSVFMAITAVFLAGLAITLTVCTAGTWWTIATKARPLFAWMSKMPSFIMGVINPIITGASAIFFNLQNTAGSLEMVDETLRSKKNIFKRAYDFLVNSWNHLRNTENWGQILNPARLLVKLVVTPLRVVLFLGHLLSMALTSDRMPGIPKILAILVAIISEGFEDVPYFFASEHQHEDEEHTECHDAYHEHDHDFKQTLKEHLDSDSGHEHGLDIPSKIVQFLASPLYALAAAWDSFFSRYNAGENGEKKVLSFNEAWNKQRGVKEEQDVVPPNESKRPSTQWQVEHVVSLIEKQSKKLEHASVSQNVAEEKITELQAFKTRVRTQKLDQLPTTLKQEKNNPVYNQHRLFAVGKQTHTQLFIEELGERVSLGPCNG